jgi:integrase
LWAIHRRFYFILFQLVLAHFAAYRTTVVVLWRHIVGTIVVRKRTNGSSFYTSQIVIKRDGKAYREAKSFDRRQAANAWLVRREAELRRPGGLERAGKDDPKLAAVIDQYLAESEKRPGPNKANVLRTIKNCEIAELKCSQIGSDDLLAFLRSLSVEPQTRLVYLSHLSAVFAIAKPAWGYPLDHEAMKSAFVVAKRLGVIAKGPSRTRRPTLDELGKLMQYFGTVKARYPGSIPMQRIIPFAIFSTRRQEEITTIRWADYEGNRILVKNMKDPSRKAGNNIWCELVSEASAIIDSQPRRDERIFPFTPEAISEAFTRACKVLGIGDLRFHDLRHEGVSRLFEMGWTIPRVSGVSGHRSWQSLQRYTHLRQVGDKYAEWEWGHQ